MWTFKLASITYIFFFYDTFEPCWWQYFLRQMWFFYCCLMDRRQKSAYDLEIGCYLIDHSWFGCSFSSPAMNSIDKLRTYFWTSEQENVHESSCYCGSMLLMFLWFKMSWCIIWFTMSIRPPQVAFLAATFMKLFFHVDYYLNII